MYQALGIKKLISILAAICCLFFAGFLLYAPPDSPLDWLRHASTAVTPTAITVGLLGNKWVFCKLWRLKLIERLIFPFIAGEWIGTISSNWPVVQAMMIAFNDPKAPKRSGELHIDQIGTTEKKIRVQFDADFFHISMRLDTDDGYSASYSVFVKPIRKADLGRPRLYYMYRNETQSPEITDSSEHLGAAYLETNESAKGLSLEGIYWTARNWPKGLNTAGRISLHRKTKATTKR
jgi:SMODS-associating 2TM, beta-strand rich effector domain